MVERFDGVVVSGAGPVGLVTALSLARAGVPVLVLEAGQAIDSTPRAIVYHPPTVEALDRLGVLDDMTRIGVVKRDYLWRDLDGNVLARVDMGVLRPGDTAYPYNLHLGQHELAGVVLQHLLRLPNAVVRWNHAVTGVTQSGNRVRVTVDAGGERHEAEAPFLVGADGANSGVRRALGMALDGYTWPEWFVATDLHYDFLRHGHARATFIVDPVHWAVIPQISEAGSGMAGRWRLTYGEPAEVPREALRGRVAAKYAAVLPGCNAGDDLPEPVAFSPYRVHDRCAERFRVGRVLLAGDAAHLNNPIGGLGLTGGVLDAILLGRVLAAVMAGSAGDRALDAYAAERRRVFTEVVSPAARENKRRMSEADPARRAADRDRFKRLDTDREFARQAMLFTQALVGRPVPV